MDDDALAAHLRDLEDALLDPAVRASGALLDDLLAPDVVEFGASGRRYDREALVRLLAAHPRTDGVVIEDFVLRRLAPDVALVTYRSRHGDEPGGTGGPRANRSSIWRRDETGWRLVFHQGTPADG